MFRFLTMSIAALALTLTAVSGAAAAEGKCAAGVGKYVCCKAGVADHCGHVSCCEVGNAAFFSAKHCGSCASHKSEKPAHQAAAKTAKAAGHGCASSAAGCETGNRGFFKATACGGCDKAEKASACCAGEKAK